MEVRLVEARVVEETVEQVARERKEEMLVAKERRKQEVEKEEEGKSLLEQFQVLCFNPFLFVKTLEHVVNLGQIRTE